MKKILILIPSHPTAIQDISIYLNSLLVNDYDNGDICVIGPQMIALMIEANSMVIEDNKKIITYPYINNFFTCIDIFEKNKEMIVDKFPITIVVGTVDANSKNWYDAIIGFDDNTCKEYVFNQIYNVNNTKCLSMKDVDEGMTYSNKSDLSNFIKWIIKQDREERKKEKENGI